MIGIADDCNHKISNLISDETRHRAIDESFIKLPMSSAGLPEKKIAKLLLSTRSAPTSLYPERIPFSNG